MRPTGNEAMLDSSEETGPLLQQKIHPPSSLRLHHRLDQVVPVVVGPFHPLIVALSASRVSSVRPKELPFGCIVDADNAFIWQPVRRENRFICPEKSGANLHGHLDVHGYPKVLSMEYVQVTGWLVVYLPLLMERFEWKIIHFPGHFPVSELIARTEIKKQHNLIGG